MYLYHENHGSDHGATYSEWNFRTHRNVAIKARKAYDRADSDMIGWEAWRLMRPWETLSTIDPLDSTVEKLTEATASAVDRYTVLWTCGSLPTQSGGSPLI